MICVMCGEPETIRKTNQEVPLDVGLPGARIAGITVEVCPACGEEYYELPPLEQLLGHITEVLANAPGRLSGAEIRFLRKRLGWSGKDFADQFCVDPTTVSKWENDKYKMDAFKDKMLRQLALRGPLMLSYDDEEDRGEVEPAFRIYVPTFRPDPEPTPHAAPRRRKANTKG